MVRDPRATKRPAQGDPDSGRAPKKLQHGTMSDEMKAFVKKYRDLKDIAIQRDNGARVALTDRYDLYKQGSYKVIKARTFAPFDPSDVAVSLGTKTNQDGRTVTKCSKCPGRWFADFPRHRETHVRNPANNVFCFVCNEMFVRTDKISCDEHLYRHMIFVNMEGLAGEMVHNTEGRCFKRIGVGLAKRFIEEQMPMLLEVAGPAALRGKACAFTWNEHLNNIVTNFGGMLPTEEQVEELRLKDAHALMKDMRKAIKDLGGNLEWEGMRGEHIDLGESAAEDSSSSETETGEADGESGNEGEYIPE